MKYIFNRCAKIFQGDDVIIHYTTGDNGLEIVAFCPFMERKQFFLT